MIDPALLKQLGWSDDLIGSVTAMANQIATEATQRVKVAPTSQNLSVQSVTTVAYVPSGLPSSNGVFLSTVKAR
jgi:hypothetical protein